MTDEELIERLKRASESSRETVAYGTRFRVYEGYEDFAAAAATRLAALIEERDRLREALEPFAKAAAIKLCGGPDFWTDTKPIQGTDIAFHITFGDLSTARAALQPKDADHD